MVDLNEPHLTFLNRGLFDWESNRVNAERQGMLFPSLTNSMQDQTFCGCTPYMKCSTHSEYTYARSPFERGNQDFICTCLICRPDLHRQHITDPTKYSLLRPMPTSYHCLLDPNRRLTDRPCLDGMPENVTVTIPGLNRYDREPPLAFDMPKQGRQNLTNKNDAFYTWYHDNEPDVGKILPVNYWNRHRMVNGPSSYLVPTVL
ncbi:unnamed protein product [Didymodactylos carnosus]|uniref:Uncharacterized protein n=1 Tax=Didymodactylos carnosus TaxID=1234261 RepID=A0A813Y9A4_9BILA|nr:unnamed protein product [Didymodactylos carnosus]CAF1318563.1 unnamed protein product [Didymodactylos carnosus]CAF3667138.1 unnamed protein product [Didymodactylos carnosus]CAF4128064.1 unnamed protein product [Didymodactylos carnosus]